MGINEPLFPAGSIWNSTKNICGVSVRLKEARILFTFRFMCVDLMTAYRLLLRSALLSVVVLIMISSSSISSSTGL